MTHIGGKGFQCLRVRHNDEDHLIDSASPTAVPATPPESPDVGTGGREKPNLCLYCGKDAGRDEDGDRPAFCGACESNWELGALLRDARRTGDTLHIGADGSVSVGRFKITTDATRALARALAHRGTA
jgi:hypothetical protein